MAYLLCLKFPNQIQWLEVTMQIQKSNSKGERCFWQVDG